MQGGPEIGDFFGGVVNPGEANIRMDADGRIGYEI